MKKLSIQKFLIPLLVIILILATANMVYSVSKTPNDNQYMELKLVKIQETQNGKQMIMEWWSHNVNFKGLDIRFQYDITKVKPSSIENNKEVYDSSIFEFSEDFEPYMDYLVLNDIDGENVVRMNMSLLTENLATSKNEHIKQLDDGTYYVDTEGDVLIGQMSFKLYDDELDETTFNLKKSSTNSSPLTGIKINIDGKDTYEDQKVFKFTLLSNNANLSNLEKCIYNKEESEEIQYTRNRKFRQRNI